ncbi:MAG TPA: hypothetical protein VGH76_10380 [Actinomycetospora sp.]|uniref:hypothetical protein n=1 Tax=Actinomycetospora sp. TaxID=1872135 RepID=UPI002F4259EC
MASRRRLRVVMVVTTLVVAAVPVGVSIGQALGGPGQASTSVRLVEWLRDHGGGGVVSLGENLWYARNRPSSGAPDPASIPAMPATSAAAPTSTTSGPPALPAPDPALPSEARWVPSTQRIRGRAPLYSAFFRPLPASSVVVGVAWVDQSLTRTRLIAGTQDPVRSLEGTSPDGAAGQVPTSARPGLLATFNSGFKLKDARGGYYAAGREVVPLRAGGASLVVDDTCRVDIGAWGRDVGPTPRMAAVRQNLDLLVDHGVPVPGLDANSADAWGSSNNQFQYTWRSGLGVDPRGDLLYVAADHISLADLAHCLSAAGAVRGMELDIHPQMVTFLTYRPGQARDDGSGSRLLPAMRPPTNRYLVPSQRDFLAVTLR